jgi:hypothetical protein
MIIYLEQQNAVDAVTDRVTGERSTDTVPPRSYAVHASGQTAGLASNSDSRRGSSHPEGKQDSSASWDTRTRSVVVEKPSHEKLDI